MSLRDDILAACRAQQARGLPYGLPPGPGETDCSLFVGDVLRAAGIGIPGARTAEQLRQACPVIVDWPDVLPGDLLFFVHTYEPSEPPGPDGEVASHIGISLGAGTRQMWDAHQRSNQPGAVGITTLSADYWQPKLLEARRPPGLANEPSNISQDILRGIDVSNHQGHIEWPRVAAAGYTFAFIKASEGDGYLDPYLAYNWQQAKTAGLSRGCYHYARPEESNTAKSEATYFVGNVMRQGQLEPGDMLVLDLEPSVPVAHLGIWALDWLQEVEMRTGVHPIVYTGAWVAEQQGLASWPSLGTYELWLAAYAASKPAAPAPWTNYRLWQYSSTGRVPGVNGDCDLDTFYGTRADLLALGKRGTIAEQPTPAYAVGSGLLALMTADGTEPAAPSTFLPLGQRPAVIEEAYGMNGVRYAWRIPDGRHWRYSPDAA